MSFRRVLGDVRHSGDMTDGISEVRCWAGFRRPVDLGATQPSRARAIGFSEGVTRDGVPTHAGSISDHRPE